MTIFASSGPGVQAANDDRPDGMSAPFAHIHQARCVGVPPEYDQISGPVELAPGIKISWASRPGTDDRLPWAVVFDADRISEQAAKSWLSSHNVDGYEWEPDSRDKTPTTGCASAEGEKQPEGFPDLRSFLEATVEVDRSAPPTAADVERAGRSLGLDAVCRSLAFHTWNH